MGELEKVYKAISNKLTDTAITRAKLVSYDLLCTENGSITDGTVRRILQSEEYGSYLERSRMAVCPAPTPTDFHDYANLRTALISVLERHGNSVAAFLSH
jgi:hypothetical protein